MRQRGFQLMVGAVVGVLLSIGSAMAQSSSDGVITIHAVGLRNSKGDVVCTLCSSSDGYPGDCKQKTVVKASITDEQADCVFPHKASGDYGASIFHDEDGSGKFKRNLLGIPQEGFGFSNNYHPKTRAPTWNEGKFNFSGGHKTITIKMIYW